MHELYVCGGLTVQFCNALVNIINNAITGAASGTPAEFEWDGQGAYRTGSGEGRNSTEMKLQFITPVDRIFAAAGEVVPYNLFNFENYLKDCSNLPKVFPPKLFFGHSPRLILANYNFLSFES